MATSKFGKIESFFKKLSKGLNGLVAGAVASVFCFTGIFGLVGCGDDTTSTDDNAVNSTQNLGGGTNSITQDIGDNSSASEDSETSSDAVSSNVIANLWDNTNSKFNINNLNSVAELAGYTDIYDLVADTDFANGTFTPKTATDLASTKGEYTIKFGEYNFNNKTYELQWIPAYLSADNNGNPILTLWLANTDAANGTSSNQEVGTFSDGTYSGIRTVIPSSNNYSTSYIRAVTLNNGGSYKGNYGGENSSTQPTEVAVTQSTNGSNKFELFTTGALAEYIVKPYDVSWQTAENYYKNDIAYTAQMYSYTNGGWTNDLLWLPGSYETVDTTITQNCTDITTSFTTLDGGLWELSTNQLRNTIQTYLRSARYDPGFGDVFAVSVDGTSETAVLIASSYAVRPALHLNLKAAAALKVPTTSKAKTYCNKAFTVSTAFSDATTWYDSAVYPDASKITCTFLDKDGKTVSALNYGTYTARFSIVSGSNLYWKVNDAADMTTSKDVSFTINKASIEVELKESPASSGNYTASVKSGLPSGATAPKLKIKYTNSDGYNDYTPPTQRGTYTMKVELDDSDTTSNNYVIKTQVTGTYVVGPMVITKPTVNESDGDTLGTDIYTYNGSDYEFSISNVSSYITTTVMRKIADGTETDVTRDVYAVGTADPTTGLSTDTLKIKDAGDYTIIYKLNNADGDADEDKKYSWGKDSSGSYDYGEKKDTFTVSVATLTISSIKFTDTTNTWKNWENGQKREIYADVTGIVAADAGKLGVYISYTKSGGTANSVTCDIDASGRAKREITLKTGSYTLEVKLADVSGTDTKYKYYPALSNYKATPMDATVNVVAGTAQPYNASWSYTASKSGTFNVTDGDNNGDVFDVGEYNGESYDFTFNESCLNGTGLEVVKSNGKIVYYDDYTGITNAGSYKVTVHIVSSDQSVVAYPETPCTLEYTISPQKIDLSNVKWDYTSAFTYDGTEKAVQIDSTTLPALLEVAAYSGTTKETNANSLNTDGTRASYTAGVTFKISSTATVPSNYALPVQTAAGGTPNYNFTDISGARTDFDWELNWTINPAQLDVSQLKWNYDAANPFQFTMENGAPKEQTVKLENLPTELESMVTYANNTGSAVTTYSARYTMTLSASDLSNFELVVPGVTATIDADYIYDNIVGRDLNWKIVEREIVKPATTMPTITFDNNEHDLIKLSGVAGNGTDYDWTEYLDYVILKDGVDYKDANGDYITEVTDAGTYTLRLSFKSDATMSAGWVDGTSDINFKTLDVTCVVDPLTITVTGWQHTPPVPKFSQEVAGAFYDVIYKDSNGTAMTATEATSHEMEVCVATIQPADGMNNNVIINAKDETVPLEKEYVYSSQPPTYLTKPTLKSSASELVYSGEEVDITQYLDGFDPETMTAEGSVKVTDAGAYKVIVGINSSLYGFWSDDDTSDKVAYEFDIDKKVITAEWTMVKHVPVLTLPEGVEAEYTYYDTDGNQIAAGAFTNETEYTVTAKLSEKDEVNYIFIDPTTSVVGEAAQNAFVYEKYTSIFGFEVPKGFPEWQIYVIILALIIAALEFTKTGFNVKRLKKLQAELDEKTPDTDDSEKLSSYGGAAILLTFLGLSGTIWTFIAIGCLVLVLAGFIAMVATSGRCKKVKGDIIATDKKLRKQKAEEAERKRLEEIEEQKRLKAEEEEKKKREAEEERARLEKEAKEEERRLEKEAREEERRQKEEDRKREREAEEQKQMMLMMMMRGGSGGGGSGGGGGGGYAAPMPYPMPTYAPPAQVVAPTTSGSGNSDDVVAKVMTALNPTLQAQQSQMAELKQQQYTHEQIQQSQQQMQQMFQQQAQQQKAEQQAKEQAKAIDEHTKALEKIIEQQNAQAQGQAKSFEQLQMEQTMAFHQQQMKMLEEQRAKLAEQQAKLAEQQAQQQAELARQQELQQARTLELQAQQAQAQKLAFEQQNQAQARAIEQQQQLAQQQMQNLVQMITALRFQGAPTMPERNDGKNDLLLEQLQAMLEQQKEQAQKLAGQQQELRQQQQEQTHELQQRLLEQQLAQQQTFAQQQLAQQQQMHEQQLAQQQAIANQQQQMHEQQLAQQLAQQQQVHDRQQQIAEQQIRDQAKQIEELKNQQNQQNNKSDDGMTRALEQVLAEIKTQKDNAKDDDKTAKVLEQMQKTLELQIEQQNQQQTRQQMQEQAELLAQLRSMMREPAAKEDDKTAKILEQLQKTLEQQNQQQTQQLTQQQIREQLTQQQIREQAELIAQLKNRPETAGKDEDKTDRILEQQNKALEQQGKTLEQQGKTLEQQGKTLEQLAQQQQAQNQTTPQPQPQVVPQVVEIKAQEQPKQDDDTKQIVEQQAKALEQQAKQIEELRSQSEILKKNDLTKN